MLSVTRFVLVLGLAELVFSQQGWVPNGASEYYFGVNSGEFENTWHSARSWCMQNGADLVSIDDDSERTWISSQLGNSGYDGYVFNGLNKYYDQSRWTWGISDDVVDGDSSWWREGYPHEDTFIPYLCVEQEATDPLGELVNSHCDNKRGYVCERPSNSQGDPITDSPTSPVNGFCPQDYIGVGNKCFRVVIIDVPEEGFTWREATEICRRGPGVHPDIASITGEMDNAIVTSQLQEQIYGVWIGMTRSDYNDAWRWADNSPVVYNNWGPNQPIETTSHCVEIWTNPGPVGTWNNHNCEAGRGYVCQTYKDASNVVSTDNPTPFPCPAEYSPYFYGCYKVHSTASTWDQAQSTCVSEGGNLASIHYEAENAAIFTQVLDRGAPLWIGIQDNDNDGEYTWSDSWYVRFTAWDESQPSANGQCGVMLTTGVWATYDCVSKQQFICKQTDAPQLTPPAPAEGSCPGEGEGDTSWVQYGSYCYKFITDTHMTWKDAQLSCAAAGPSAALVSVHNVLENDFILRNVEDTFSHIWTGLHRNRQTREFQWLDGTPVQFTNWAPGEPNGEEAGQDCVEIYHDFFHGAWNDHACTDYSNAYVCKAPKGQPITDVPSIPGTCPDGWQPWGAHCYFFEPNKITAWSTAEEDCLLKGGAAAKLASIHSSQENSFIVRTMQEIGHLPDGITVHFWIGMIKNGPLEDGFDFFWLDNSEWVYENWALNEPSDTNNIEDCVEVYGDNDRLGQWNDIYCDQFKGYVCKLPKAGVQSSGMSGGAIAGIVIGVLAGVLLLGALVFIVVRGGIPTPSRAPARSDPQSSDQGIANPTYDTPTVSKSEMGDSVA